jgi:hypothetical protein
MADYPYTTVPGKIKPLLSKIREVGVPSKANMQWLKSIGFKSSNDASLLTVLRFIGLVDTSGTPTDAWKNYRGAKHGQVLASAIRQGYSDLFAVYPDANARNTSEIEHVISTTSSAGKQAIAKTVRTFQKTYALKGILRRQGKSHRLHLQERALLQAYRRLARSPRYSLVRAQHLYILIYRSTFLQTQAQNRLTRSSSACQSIYINKRNRLSYEGFSKGCT